MTRPKLFLLDAMALIYRAHFSFAKNPRITSYGLNTSATFGFTNTILEVIQKEKPTHLAVLFDSETATHRHEKLDSYKGTRQEVPEDLVKNLPFIRRMLDALRIARYQLDGYEADDLLGRIALEQAAAGMDVYIMTSDKDLAQLVRPHIWLYKPAFMGNPPKKLDEAGVLADYGVPPALIPDLLGLKGDSVDNIPGIPKIGDKTAVELLQQFGSLEAVLARAEEVTKKSVRETLLAHADQGRFSKELATLHPDVPLTYSAEDLRLEPPNTELLEPLLAELEFKTLSQRILGHLPKAHAAAAGTLFGPPETPAAPTAPDSPAANTPAAPEPLPFGEPLPAVRRLADLPHTYTVLNSVEAIREAVRQLGTPTRLCFDTETTDVDPLQAELVGLALSTLPGTAYYIPLPPDRAETLARLEALKPLLLNTAIEKVGQNLKYDLHVLENYGVQVVGPFFDTMIAHYVLESSGKHNMDVMARRFLNYEPVSITELIGKKGKDQGNMRNVEVERVAEYAGEDADITLQLHAPLHQALAAEPKLNTVYAQLDLPLMPVLQRMERAGIALDTDFLNDYSKELEIELKRIELEIYALSGEPFNINSPKQLGEILFDKLKLSEKPKKTATGQYSTDEETLQALAHVHELPARILDSRSLSKLKSTYVDALPTLVNPHTGRVHTTYNQTVAVTGRLSSNNPNLQNIPIRTDKGKEVRKAFITPSPDHVLLSADYSQIELRIMAALSQDQALLENFRTGQDVHTTTASKVFGVTPAEVTGEMRRKAKMVNFGIIYGITPFGLAQRLGIPRAEAKEIIDNYFLQFPRVQSFMSDLIQRAREQGYAETQMGRRHYLPDIHSQNMTTRNFAERNAINTPVQGTAADLIKLAMIKLDAELTRQGLRSRLLLQVHDELLLEVPLNELETAKQLVQHCMETAMDLGVPLETNLGTGRNWLDAH